jgi:Na+-translocating ferredoxin:NAD+ oxidoreductase RnfG subunit
MDKNNNSFGSSAICLIVIFAVFAGILFGVNSYTAPVIEWNDNAAVLEPLFRLLPEAEGFKLLYDASKPEASELKNVPDTVRYIHSVTPDAGFALRLSTTEGYTHEPIEISFAVDPEGKIINAQVDAYPDTKDMGVDTYPLTYIGQDSALSDVSLVAGVTFSSSAFKKAIADGFSALVDNGLVAEGYKDPLQALNEVLPVVFPGIANNSGIVQAEELQPSGTLLQTAMKSTADTGMAYFAGDGEDLYLIVVNASGVVKAYDTKGNDITDSAPAQALEEAAADAETNRKDYLKKDTKAFKKLTGDDLELTVLAPETFNSVTGAYKLLSGGETYYGFTSRTFGFGDMQLVTRFVLDGTGKIVSMNADELILEKEYFSSYTLDESSYKAGFTGLTADSFTAEDTLIAGATMSSNAVKTAVYDVFAAFQNLQNSGGI